MATKRYIHAAIAVAITVMLANACRNDDIVPPQTQQQLMLSLSVNGTNQYNKSRTTASMLSGENEITKNLHLLFFDADENGNGQLVEHVDMGNPTNYHDVQIPIPATEISARKAYFVIAVANIDDYLEPEWIQSMEGQDKNFFNEEIIAKMVNSNMAANNLPMFGSMNKTKDLTTINIVLERCVARIDVELANSQYSIVSAQLANVFRETYISGEKMPDFTNSSDKYSRLLGAPMTPTEGSENAVKGLYTFENYSSTPAQDDLTTTCVVVGLKDASQTTTYHRINVKPQDGAQALRRNCIYHIRISGVHGQGMNSADDALVSPNDNLFYQINNWSVSDEQAVVSDARSVLAMPIKTAFFGRDGGSESYTITTFSTLKQPEQLSIKSIDDANNQFSAQLVGNELTISANSMPSDDDIDGCITLQYAGLTIDMYIKQSLHINKVLTISYADEWTNLIAGGANAKTKEIMVTASEDWTAEIIGEAKMAFDIDAYPTTITSSQVTDNKFSLIAYERNPYTDRCTNAFVIVSLNSDPVNYVRVIDIKQDARGTMYAEPKLGRIEFDGEGKIEGSTETEESVSFTCPKGCKVSVKLDGDNSDKFVITTEQTDIGTTKCTIKTASLNPSASNYLARMIALNENGAECEIEIVQKTLPIAVVTDPYEQIDEDGVTISNLKLDTYDPNAVWKASVVVEGEAGKPVFNHNVKLKRRDNNLMAETLEGLNKNILVDIVFPKIYYPNRERTITATVTITTEYGATATKKFTQSKLMPRRVVIWNTGGGYGTLGDNYFDGYTDMLYAQGYLNSLEPTPTTEIPDNTTYIHFGNGNVNYTSYDWTPINSLRNNAEIITMMVCDKFAFNALSVLNKTDSPTKIAGYAIAGGLSTVGRDNRLDSNSEETVIMQFLTTKGKFPIQMQGVGGFYVDEYHTTITQRPTSAISIAQDANGKCIFTIDPDNELIYLGESQLFQKSRLDGDNMYFALNFLEYVINAAKYGSHFTDMFKLENPADEPWSPLWGHNAWPN